ncbi:hypothetical protein TWF481_003337 [Arthrobotrys musiformis]|uniref:Mitochondrial zinc maintenance protein 1, mitochondrial n=1 Tax=Arthrobotrys musiformis TaxID=47236 RepID=A0AAV9VPY0_9PEZI
MRFPASKQAALHQNVAHRAACLALYRRLLKHAKSTTTTLPALQNLKPIITREFKKHNTRDIAVSTLRDALSFGYKAETSLRLAISGDKIEQTRLSAFLTLTRTHTPPLTRMQAANITIQPTPKPKPPKAINPNLALLPFDLRFKPTIIGGNTIPFVRYTGTKQSPVLSGILNKKVLQKVKRDDAIEALKWDREYANNEDAFESEIWNEAGREWRLQNADQNPTAEGYWKTEVGKAQMELQVKLWANQVQTWERSGRCMDVIETHKRRVAEFMDNLKAERARAKGKVVPAAKAVEAALDPQTVESTKGPKPTARQKERLLELSPDDDADAQMEALNEQLIAAGFNPTSRAPKPKPFKRGNNFESRDHKPRGNSRRTDNTRQNSYSKPRSHHDDKSKRDTKPRSKQPPPQSQEGENDGKRDKKENRHSQRHDNGALVSGKGKRSRRGLDIGKVFGPDD